MNPYYVTCLSAITAALVAWVAVQQYRLAHDRLKLDLWEKRYAVYKGAHRFLSLVVQAGATDIKELFGFLEDTRDAFFLFRPDMAAYLEGLYRKGVDLRTTRVLYQNKDGVERDQLIDKEARLLTELGEELVELKHRFSPYLKLARR
jgi:hypothetical protein